jgi:hypothetical protein
MKRIFSLLLVISMLLGCALALGSCSAPANYGAEISVYLGESVYDFDPTDYFVENNARKVLSLLFEPLFSLNSRGGLENAAAAGYRVDRNERQIVINLKESYWSDACRAISTLSKIEVSPENPKYHAQGNCLIETATKTLLYGCKTSAIPADGSVTKIGIMAFYGAQDLTDLVIPDSVETICENAFAGCTNLQWLVIGSGVKTIDIDILIRSNASLVIYYMGAAEDWEKIEIRKYNVGPDWGNNAALKNAPRYYYSETEPTEPGNYWHYVDGVPTPWKTEE